MESLPLEVVQIIAQYLSAQDLAACCATSHRLRDVLNRDLFWKPLTNQDTADYLSRTPCRVQPAFISPEVEGSGLDPVCQWRMNYMRENHLFNNWRSGRCNEDYLKMQSFKRENDIMLFYQEEFLITVTKSPVSILIWDLRCDPALYVDNPCGLIPFQHVTNVVLFGDKLVIMHKSAVLVFQINLMKNIWTLESIFLLEADEPTYFIHPFSVYANVGNILTVGNYLLAVQSTIESCLHIWNLVNYSKSRREPFNSSVTPIIESSKTSLDAILVIFSMPGREYKRVLVYSLISFTYYPCVFEGAGLFSLHRNKVVVNMKIPNEHWLIVNYKTGEQIFEIDEKDSFPGRSIEVYGNQLIYSTHSGFFQINLSSGKRKRFLGFRCDNNHFRVLKDKIFRVEIGLSRRQFIRSYGIIPPVIGKIVSMRLETIFRNRNIEFVNRWNITLTNIIVTDTADRRRVISFW